ncbi:putative bifunctional diguanylate cyclase/phosphodiesterase [Blastococcus sp. SYSU D00695]
MLTRLPWPGADLRAPREQGGAKALLGDLSVAVPVLDGTDTCEDLDRLFRRADRVTCAVVRHPQHEDVLGLVDRARFTAMMSGPYGYGRSLHGRRPLTEVAQWDALTLPPETSVVEAASRAITRSPEHVQDDVLVAAPEGPAAVAMPVLLSALAHGLADQALRDPLTGLANRQAFFGRVEESCRRSATQPGHRTAVVYLDLDGFKAVNDALGHDAGDALLVATAQALRESARDGDLVSRLGGDEFAVCVDIDVADGPDLGAAVAARLHAAVLAVGATVEGGPSMRVSTGVAVSGGGHVDPAELVRAADLAMYTGKRDGGASVVGPVLLTTSADADPLLGTTVPEVAARGELRLLYQPIVDLDDGRTASVEALVRWRHPRLGMLTPDAFLPAMARAGQLLDLDEWVLRTAIAEFAAAGPAAGPGGVPVALNLNVTPERLLTPGLEQLLVEATAAAGLDRRLVRVELPEQLLVDELHRALPRLAELRAAGFDVTFDDVGAGGTSLRHLREVRADGLKIDRSYVQGLLTDARDRALVQLLVDFGTGARLRVTAEGVETTEQRDALRAMGCRYGQGWLFGRPRPLAEVLPAAVPVG